MSTGKQNDPVARPLADDAGFMDSLSDLDDGLSGPADRSTGRPSSDRKSAAIPAAKLEAQFATLQEAFASSSATSDAPPQLPPVVNAPGRRPLLDLFPSESDPIAPPFAERARVAPSPTPPRVTTKRQTTAPATAAGAATYETFYGLNERPFSLSSDPKFLYQSGEYDRVVQKMLGAIGRREPLVVLTGEMGVGKTTLCRALVEQLDRRTLTSVVSDPVTSIADFFKTLLVDFGVVARDELARGRMATASQGELAGALRDFLTSLAPLQAFAVVIVDEAQTIPPDVLHELGRVVTGEKDRMMQIVLVGQPPLATRLEKQSSSELALAVSLRLVLGPLADDEVGGYVLTRLRVAGTSPRVDFDEDATRRLFELSGGKPRLVNLLSDRALVAGFNKSASVIDEELINSAAEDLDMAPPVKAGALGNAATAGMLVLLMFVGAAAGALMFRSDVAAILSRLF